VKNPLHNKGGAETAFEKKDLGNSHFTTIPKGIGYYMIAMTSLH
jgi:hypothetical protein